MLRVLQTAPPHHEYNKTRDFSGSEAIKQDGYDTGREDGERRGRDFRQRKQLEPRQAGNYLQPLGCFLTTETTT